jgi:hypothetical protein
MKVNELFSNKQFGFISGRSTSLQLLAVLDKWTEALDNGTDVDVIYMEGGAVDINCTACICR